MGVGIMSLAITLAVSAFVLFNAYAERKQEEVRRDFIRKSLQKQNG